MALLAAAVNDELIASDSYREISDVFESPTSSLATLRKYRDEDFTLDVLKMLIEKLVLMTNVGRGMNQYQIDETAKMILSEYYFLTVGDIKVCFRWVLLGRYGQLYDRLDPMTVLDFIRRYSDERAAHAQKRSESAHNEEKSGRRKGESVPMPEWFIEKLAEIEGRKKKPVLVLGKTTFPKYASLQAYFDENGLGDAKERLLKLWSSEVEGFDGEIELEDYLFYRAAQLLNQINSGSELDENTKEILSLSKPTQK